MIGDDDIESPVLDVVDISSTCGDSSDAYVGGTSDLEFDSETPPLPHQVPDSWNAEDDTDSIESVESNRSNSAISDLLRQAKVGLLNMQLASLSDSADISRENPVNRHPGRKVTVDEEFLQETGKHFAATMFNLPRTSKGNADLFLDLANCFIEGESPRNLVRKGSSATTKHVMDRAFQVMRKLTHQAVFDDKKSSRHLRTYSNPGTNSNSRTYSKKDRRPYQKRMPSRKNLREKPDPQFNGGGFMPPSHSVSCSALDSLESRGGRIEVKCDLKQVAPTMLQLVKTLMKRLAKKNDILVMLDDIIENHDTMPDRLKFMFESMEERIIEQLETTFSATTLVSITEEDIQPMVFTIEDIFKSEFCHLAIDRVPLKDHMRSTIQEQLDNALNDTYTDKMFSSFLEHFNNKPLKRVVLSVAGDTDEFDSKMRNSVRASMKMNVADSMKNQVSEHASEMIPHMMRRATTAAFGDQEKRPETVLQIRDAILGEEVRLDIVLFDDIWGIIAGGLWARSLLSRGYSFLHITSLHPYFGVS